MGEEAGLAALALVAAADFPPALVALIILLGLLALIKVTGYSIAFPVRSLPAPLSGLADAITGAFSAIEGYVSAQLSGWAESALSPVITFITYLGYTLPQLLLQTQTVFDSLASFAGYVVQTIVPRLYGDLGTYSEQLYTLATAWAYGALTDLYDGLQTAVAQLTALIGSTADELRSDINVALGDAVAYTDTQAETVADAVADTYDAAAGYAARAAGYATEYAGQGVTDTRRWTDDALDASHSALASALAGTQDWAGDALAALDAKSAADLAGLAAFVGTAVVPAVATLEDAAAKCFQPTCDNLLEFGNVLKALAPLVEGGGILALVAEAVRDPQGTAEAVHGLAQPVIDAQRAILSAATGL